MRQIIEEKQFNEERALYHLEETTVKRSIFAGPADVRGNVVLIKNPKSGKIIVDSVGEIIREAPVMECTGEVICRSI